MASMPTISCSAPRIAPKATLSRCAKTTSMRSAGAITVMPLACAETYAVEPEYYGSTFCCNCGGYFPVGANGEFIWKDGQKVGTRRSAP